jgi:hypothetical protein
MLSFLCFSNKRLTIYCKEKPGESSAGEYWSSAALELEDGCGLSELSDTIEPVSVITGEGGSLSKVSSAVLTFAVKWSTGAEWWFL